MRGIPNQENNGVRLMQLGGQRLYLPLIVSITLHACSDSCYTPGDFN
jgi:hypothetical protein